MTLGELSILVNNMGLGDETKPAEGSTQALWNQVLGIVKIVIWILVGILAVVLVVKGVSTALAVVKAADEPQVRQEKIAAFKYLGIGLGIALIIAALAGTLLEVFGNKIVANIQDGADKGGLQL